LPEEYRGENLELLRAGLSNLKAHLAIVRKFGVPAVVSINAFPTDTQAEWDLVKQAALEAGAADAVVAQHWRDGGEGAVDLARAVEKACELPSDFRFLYPLEAPLRTKIETLAAEVYGADGVDYSAEASQTLDKMEESGYGSLPICTAKTQYSLSHDPALKGAPRGYRFPIREVRLSAGAGFVYPLCGDMTTMPGLPSKPAFMGIDVDADGRIVGLS